MLNNLTTAEPCARSLIALLRTINEETITTISIAFRKGTYLVVMVYITLSGHCDQGPEGLMGQQGAPVSYLTVQDFGAVENDTLDDWDALQAALDARTLVWVPPGVYIVKKSLYLRSGSRLRGMNISEYAGRGNQFLFSNASIIRYNSHKNIDFRVGAPPDSTSNPDIYAHTVIVCSRGVMPNVDPQYYKELDGEQFAGTRTLQSVELSNLVIDGNGKADYGLYCFRTVLSDFHDLVITNTKRLACWGGGLYDGIWENIIAIANKGAGLQFGGMPVNWSSGWDHTLINNVTFKTLSARNNGEGNFDYLISSFSEPFQNVNQYGVDLGFTAFGIALILHRGNLVTQIHSEFNRGPGLYFSPTFGPNTFSSGYFEHNGHGASEEQNRIAVWIELNPSAFMAHRDLWPNGEPPGIPQRPFTMSGFWSVKKLKVTCFAWAPSNWKDSKCCHGDQQGIIENSIFGGGFDIPSEMFCINTTGN